MDGPQDRIRRLTPVSPPREISSVRSEKVSKVVARLIAREVADRKLQPGSALPPEHVMADHYGVGRTSIREALRLLENQGLIIIRPGLGGGPIVGSPTAIDFGKTMTLFLQIQGTPFSHILDALPAIEGMCAGLAAERCATGGPERFDDGVPSSALRPPTRQMDDGEWIETSAAFHSALWDLVDNDVVKLMSGAVAFIFGDRARYDEHREWTLKERRRVHREHLKIAEAVRSGDSTAARQLNEEHFKRINQDVKTMYPSLANEAIDWH